MKKTIEFFMPVMRPNSARKVLNQLSRQTVLIDKISIINNSGIFTIDKEYPFKVDIFNFKNNTGVNFTWNLLFNSEADFIGLIGDDYIIENSLVEILSRALVEIPQAGAVTATIFRNKKIIPRIGNKIKFGEVVGRNHFGASLFKKCTLDCLPKIPEELFIFYGDHWFSYWLKKIGFPLLEVNVGVSHYDKTDLKEKCNYKRVLRTERNIWNQWKKLEIEL